MRLGHSYITPTMAYSLFVQFNGSCLTLTLACFGAVSPY